MLDSPLTRVGEQQAANLGRYLSGYNIDVIYSSSSKRAVDTAKIINSYQSAPRNLMKEDDLREIGLGEWEGMKRTEVSQLYPSLQHTYFNDPANFEPVGGGETLLEVKNRCINVLNRVISDEKGKNVLLVSHTAVVKIIMAYFDGRPFSSLWGPPRVKPACLSQVSISEDGHKIVKYADTTHLRFYRN